MIKIGELLRELWSLRSCFNILPAGTLTPQGIECAMKRDVSKHWCTLQWCASRGWFIAHENWTSCAAYPIMLGPHEAGVWAKHPSLTTSRGEPSRHLGPSYQRGESILSPLIADLSGLCRSCMVAHRDYFQDDKDASGILKIIKS